MMFYSLKIAFLKGKHRIRGFCDRKVIGGKNSTLKLNKIAAVPLYLRKSYAFPIGRELIAAMPPS